MDSSLPWEEPSPRMKPQEHIGQAAGQPNDCPTPKRNPPVQNTPAKSPSRSRALQRRTTHQVHLRRLHLTSQKIFSPNSEQLERASRHDRARLAKELASQGVTTSLEQLQSPLSRVELLSRAVGRQRDLCSQCYGRMHGPKKHAL